MSASLVGSEMCIRDRSRDPGRIEWGSSLSLVRNNDRKRFSQDSAGIHWGYRNGLRSGSVGAQQRMHGESAG
eukprot:14258458-Alexandrium_andersonii.AAC.1